MSALAPTPTPILIIWKDKSRIASDLRQNLDRDALTSPNFQLNDGNLAFDIDCKNPVPYARKYVAEFGLSTFLNVVHMCCIWYQLSAYVGLKIVFHSVGHARARVSALKNLEEHMIMKWRETGRALGRHCRYEYVMVPQSEGRGWEGPMAM
jgi:hypothetical protein